MIENIPATPDLFNGAWNTEPEWVLWTYFIPELQCSLPLFLGDFCFNLPLYTLPSNSALSSFGAMCPPWTFPTSCQSSLSRLCPGPFNDILSTGKIRTSRDDDRFYIWLLGWNLSRISCCCVESPTSDHCLKLWILLWKSQHSSLRPTSAFWSGLLSTYSYPS